MNILSATQGGRVQQNESACSDLIWQGTGTGVGASDLVVDVQGLRATDQALVRRAREQAVLYQFTDRLHRATGLAEVYDSALEAILGALRCQRAAVLLVDHAGIMRFVRWCGLSETYRRAAEGRSPWKRGETRPKPVCLRDLKTADLPEGLEAVAHAEGIGALAFMPLVINGALIGKFVAYYDAPHLFTPEELDLGLTIARQLGFGIEQKRAEEALRRSEKLFRELADFLPQIVWTARPDGYIDYFNKRWCEYTGFADAFGEESWKPILHPDDLQRCVETYYRCIREECPLEIEYRFKDRQRGGYRWFLGRALPIRDETGRVIRWFGTCTDIDDQKRSAESLEQAVAERTASLQQLVRQMEEFSYSVSHDLRAPLRAMQTYSQALLEDFGGNLGPEARQYLSRLVENATRLEKMILDVLTFSRVGQAELQLSKVSLERLVWDLVQQSPEFEPARDQIQVEPLLDVLAHEPSLAQAIANLLRNALKFVRPGTIPRVRLWTEPREREVRLWVEDNGIGVDPRCQHRLFNLFERAHPQAQYDGTGVGLAIVRKAVERMGGKVGMESDGVHGSRFWIQLRAPQPPA